MILVVMFVAAFASAVSGQYKEGSVEARLIELDKAWTSAELKGDKKAAEELVADDYVGTTQRGVLENKETYLAGVVPNADMVTSDDYKITIDGDIAIMTHRSTVKGVRNVQYRSTHVWKKHNGKWKIIAHHGSLIAEPDVVAEEDK